MSNKISYIHTQDTHNTRAAEAFAPLFFKEVGLPGSVIDVGCGIGTWLSVFKEQGVKTIFGIDGSNVDLSQLHIDPAEFAAHDLSEPIKLDRRFELAICLEVAEHLPEVSSDILINTLCDLSDKILFSAAMPNQGGQNHLNEQFFDYWRKKFNQKGYISRDLFRPKIWDDSRIDCWYRQNMFFIEKVQDDPIKQEAINAYYHPEIYTYKHSQYLKNLNAKQKLANGEISILSALKILYKSLAFNIQKVLGQ